MSDLHDPSIVDAEAVPADKAESGGSPALPESAADLTVAAQPGPDAVAQVEPTAQSEDLHHFRARGQSSQGEVANGAEGLG